MKSKQIIEPTPLEEDEEVRHIDAMQDTQYQEDSDYEEGTSLLEAETEIGIADWINPDTGELAECSVPHFND